MAAEFRSSDTIAAISTPYGTGGIGLIRISGPGAFAVVSRIFNSRKRFDDIGTHTVTHGTIVDPKTANVLDDVLLIKMQGPHTFTGEDVAEISCHGGLVVLKSVLKLVLSQGVRAAEPGEFTKRAFVNGRMDLTQAEAVIDLINARTDEGSRAAAAQLEGKISEQIRSARGQLITLIAHIEAVVDYPEHDIEELTGGRIHQGVIEVKGQLEKIAAGYERGRLLREGITAAIIGKPNAGKSSLLNQLAGSSRAIVTDIPGTTRDIIEEYINVKGIPVRFLDTAGIRETLDPVESIGVERAQKAARDAELVIAVLDAGTGILPEDAEILASIRDKKRIVLINKTDAVSAQQIAEMKAQLAGIVGIGDRADRADVAGRAGSAGLSVLVASMKDGTGLDELLDEIEALFIKGTLDINNEVMITNVRHRQLLDEAIGSLTSAENAHEGGLPLDFVTIDLKESAEALGAITGESVSEDVVREIFSRFCIGK